MPSKRKHSAMERELARTLTIACETAKSEIVGFQWLTHDVDYDAFPRSLQVTWVFDTEASLHRALDSADKARMLELTRAAFDEIGISVSTIAAHVAFRAEQPSVCKAHDNGPVALDTSRQARGKHGQGH